MRLESNIYFYLVARLLCVINCLIVLFCVAFSTGWTSRLAPVIGLIFNLACLVFIGGAIATLFVWKLNEMSLPKVSFSSHYFSFDYSVSKCRLFLLTP
uniref:MARVEL domain-containing protein n=1 Tax=Angiostrongylus cantonensis TaxID=6313 RepID=A0A0K0DL30_ANGCA